MSKGMKKNGIYPNVRINYLLGLRFLYFLLIISIVSIQNATAQTLDFVRQNEVAVEVNGKTLAYPWLGGFNNPQFSEADLNNDGILDLFVFDRASNAIIPLTHTGENGKDGYEYAPELEENFPELENWALLVDYNCDGIADLFTSNQNGIGIYKGSFNSSSQIEFQLVVEKLIHDAVVEIFVSEFDIPAIVDVNNDGDLDILTFNVAGGFIEYFENFSVENNFACGDLSDYRMLSECWGSFYESGLETSLTLDTCNNGGKKQELTVDELQKGGVHPGSTLLAIDLDGDNDKEIILGDIAFNNLVMATNGGTPNFANMVSQDTSFPSNSTPVDMKTFPAAFSIDVNRDGKKDMLVSPNAAAQSNHFECVWYYENIGTDMNPDFRLRTDTLMIENTIDVAAYSHPALFDHNSDGLLDLVIGNKGYEVRVDEFSSYLKPTLALYENIGTTHEPAFRLVSRDYMQIGTQLFTTQFDPNVEGAAYYHPTFGDLDNDGDTDLLIGDHLGYVHYFENQPTAEGIANFVKKVERINDDTGAALDVKQHATPQLVDVNEDGLLDMISGNHDGRVYYYQNVGTLQNPVFSLKSKEWGAIRPREGNTILRYTIPYMFKLQDGNFRLIVGTDAGRLFVYEDIEDNIDGGPFTLVSDEVISPVDILESSPTLADLDNDGRLDMLLGNLRGGVLWYETETIVSIEDNLIEENTMSFYPNPATSILHFDFNNTTIGFSKPNSCEVQIYNTLGQLVLTSILEREKPELSIEGLSSGLYLVEVLIDGKRIAGEKLIKK